MMNHDEMPHQDAVAQQPALPAWEYKLGHLGLIQTKSGVDMIGAGLCGYVGSAHLEEHYHLLYAVAGSPLGSNNSSREAFSICNIFSLPPLVQSPGRTVLYAATSNIN